VKLQAPRVLDFPVGDGVAREPVDDDAHAVLVAVGATRIDLDRVEGAVGAGEGVEGIEVAAAALSHVSSATARSRR